MKQETLDINALVPDDNNFNKGTKEGAALIDHSLNHFGAGRSILLDKDNRIIAGNKTAEAAIKNGFQRVRIIETQGDELIAVKRTDIDLDTKKGREFALADNIVGNINFDLDYEKVNKAMNEVELHPEIWDVRLKDETTKGLYRTEGGENKTISVDCVKFARYNIVLTEEESEALQKEISEYNKEKGNLNGFVKYIIDRYNEQQHD